MEGLDRWPGRADTSTFTKVTGIKWCYERVDLSNRVEYLELVWTYGENGGGHDSGR